MLISPEKWPLAGRGRRCGRGSGCRAEKSGTRRRSFVGAGTESWRRSSRSESFMAFYRDCSNCLRPSTSHVATIKVVSVIKAYNTDYWIHLSLWQLRDEGEKYVVCSWGNGGSWTHAPWLEVWYTQPSTTEPYIRLSNWWYWNEMNVTKCSLTNWILNAGNQPWYVIFFQKSIQPVRNLLTKTSWVPYFKTLELNWPSWLQLHLIRLLTVSLTLPWQVTSIDRLQIWHCPLT